MDNNENVLLNSEGQRIYTYKDVYQRIAYYRNNSEDELFHQYLDKVLSETETAQRPAEQLLRELDYNYKLYLDNCKARERYEEEKKPRQIEYKLGVGVLSVIGALFLITALIYFGKYFLDEKLLGVVFIAASLIIVGVSEIVLEKKFEKIAHIVTGVGIASLYFSIIFSSVNLELFNTWIAVVLIVVTSVGSYFLSRLRQSGTIEMIIGIGLASLALPYMDASTEVEFILYSAVILIANVLLFAVPMKGNFTASKIVRVVALTIAGLVLMEQRNFRNIDNLYKAGLCIAMFAVIMFAMVKNLEDSALKIVCLVCSGLFAINSVSNDFYSLWGRIITVGGMFVVCAILFLLMKDKKEKWIPYIYFMSAASLSFIASEDRVIVLLVTLVALLIAKIVLIFDDEAVKIYDNVFTVYSLVIALVCYKEPLVYAVFAAALIGCFLNSKYRMFHVIATSVALIIFSLLDGSFWMSIVLMTVALLLIVTGCIINRFEIRITGLVLSLLVCVKVALYDFREAEELTKMIVFFVVGLIAIAISIIYMYLEKKEQAQNAALKNKPAEEPSFAEAKEQPTEPVTSEVNDSVMENNDTDNSGDVNEEPVEKVEESNETVNEDGDDGNENNNDEGMLNE